MKVYILNNTPELKIAPMHDLRAYLQAIIANWDLHKKLRRKKLGKLKSLVNIFSSFESAAEFLIFEHPSKDVMLALLENIVYNFICDRAEDNVPISFVVDYFITAFTIISLEKHKEHGFSYALAMRNAHYIISWMIDVMEDYYPELVETMGVFQAPGYTKIEEIRSTYWKLGFTGKEMPTGGMFLNGTTARLAFSDVLFSAANIPEEDAKEKTL